MNVRNRAAGREDRTQRHCSGNLILARSFRVSRFGFFQHASFRSHFFAVKNFGVVRAAATTAAGTAATFATITAAGVTAITWPITAAVARADAATVAAADTVPRTWS